MTRDPMTLDPGELNTVREVLDDWLSLTDEQPDQYAKVRDLVESAFALRRKIAEQGGELE